jgi:hypothetical protein
MAAPLAPFRGAANDAGLQATGITSLTAETCARPRPAARSRRSAAHSRAWTCGASVFSCRFHAWPRRIGRASSWHIRCRDYSGPPASWSAPPPLTHLCHGPPVFAVTHNTGEVKQAAFFPRFLLREQPFPSLTAQAHWPPPRPASRCPITRRRPHRRWHRSLSDNSPRCCRITAGQCSPP